MPNDARSFSSLIRSRQHNRILRMSFPYDDGPQTVLLPNRLHAKEALSRDFEFRVELLAEDARIPLKDLLGKMVSIALVRVDGTLRYFNGYVFEFRLLKSDGGLAYYEMVLKPWMAYLALRKNNRLFHRQSLREKSDTIFREYGEYAAWDYQLDDNAQIVSATCQFDESDHNFLHRHWERNGWSYHYEFAENGHKLMLCDNSTYALPIDGNSTVPYQRHGGSREEDGIGDWSATRRIAVSAVALSSFDFKNPRPLQAELKTMNVQGKVPTVESYEYTGAYGFVNGVAGDAQSTLRMEEIEARAKQFEGRGNNSRIQPGRTFHLDGHFHASCDNDAREFLILSVSHEAGNNYLQDPDCRDEYTNELICIRKKIRWRPGRGYNSRDTRIFGIQTAIVVGPEGENIHVDEYGRVKVQFNWDRLGQNDQNSSTWIQVASGWAGGQLGLVAPPRIGQMVLVQWLGGDCDRPIITGSVANRNNMPPWALPAECSLTGMRSRELVPRAGNAAGGRSGHLIFDDTNGKIQTQLKSDHLYSQLSLGHITRIDGNAGRQDGRGQGFELRSDGVGVLRAAEGLLITSEPRPQALAHITDMGETIQRLAQGRTVHENLAALAQQHGAQEYSADQSDVAMALKLQNDAIKGSKGNGGFPGLAEPHLVLSSPTGIETTAAASTHIASGEHIALSAGSHVSVATGKSMYASVAHKFSLFVHQLGMTLIAASGKVQIQAQTDDMELLAQKVLDIISTNGWINLKAKEGIRLNGGGTELVLSAEGIKGMTDGVSHVHAADHQTMGAQSVSVQFPGAKICSSRTAGAAQSGAATIPLA
jgi:type VI secretion system secreted protein VgrG